MFEKTSLGLNIVIIDQEMRDEILESNHPHYLISASAGSGRTTILAEKALSMVDKNLIKPYQQIAMITFTRLATRQIKDKLTELLIKKHDDNNKYLKAIKVITTESFILSEVIKPFLRDAFGKDYPIEEDLVQDYNYRLDDFDNGLFNIKNNSVIGSYSERSNNFAYELGLEVLKRSINAQKYLKARFPVIMIDEYQDVDYGMHKLYMYLKNDLEIRLFVVGDIKQMLYGFRGADEGIMDSLKNDNEIRSYYLIHNFRSHSSIVNYSYQFFRQEIDIPYVPHEENRIRFYSDSNNLEACINRFISEDSSREDDTFAYLFARRGQWVTEKYYWEKKGFIFIDRPPLDSGHPNHDVLEPVLKLYFDPNQYNIYNMLDEMDIEIKSSTVRKAEIIKQHLDNDHSKVWKVIEELTAKNLLEEEKERFLETLDEKYSVNFVSDRPKRLALTIHSAKGLEFDHIFLNADSFYYYNTFLRQNHYVAITRPKKSLHIVKNEKYKRHLLYNLGIDIDAWEEQYH